MRSLGFTSVNRRMRLGFVARFGARSQSGVAICQLCLAAVIDVSELRTELRSKPHRLNVVATMLTKRGILNADGVAPSCDKLRPAFAGAEVRLKRHGHSGTCRMLPPLTESLTRPFWGSLNFWRSFDSQSHSNFA